MTALSGLFTRPLEEIAAASATTPFDCVVVGAGTSGLIFAAELARAGRTVALLEAGPLALLGHVSNSELRYDGALVRQMQRNVEYSAKDANDRPFGGLISCFGGKGLFWNGSCPRFEPHDLEGWPLTLADLQPHYESAERSFAAGGEFGASSLTRRWAQMARAAGIEARSGPFAVDTRSTTNGVVAGTIGNGISIFMRTLARHAAGSRVQAATGCRVQRVLLNAAGTEARGVAVASEASTAPLELLARSVVLAGGAFESVSLALRSELPDRSGRMGKRVTEHVFLRGNFPVPATAYDRRPEVALLHVPSAPGGRYQFELQAPGPRIFRVADSTEWNPEQTANYVAMIRSFGSVTPKDENRIELLGDGLGAFRVHITHTEADRAMVDRMRAGITALRETLGLGEAPIEDRPSGSSYHEAGGLAMGDSPETSVTDPDGCFHAVPNVVSGDAANWPDLPAANPHLSIAALAYKKSAALAARL